MHELFTANPGFSDYLAVMLQDLQYSEADNACEDEREARDTGTIYELSDDFVNDELADYTAFIAAAGDDAETFADLCGWDQFGSDFYMSRVGHGVGFSDRTSDPVGGRLDTLAQTMRSEGAYLGDDGKVYAA